MKTIMFAAVMLTAAPAFADGFGYQDGSTNDGYSGFNYQEPPPSYSPPPSNPCYPFACADED